MMNGQPGPRSLFIPPATQHVWIPFPGTKRKADSEDSDSDLGGPPPKLFAYDEDVFADDSTSYKKNDDFPNNNGILLGTLDVKTNSDASSEMNALSREDDEEMREVVSQPLSSSSIDFNCAGAPFSIDDSNLKHESGGDGKHEHVKYENGGLVVGNFGIQSNVDLNNSPKLYVLEDLKGVLSRKPNADLILERVLRKESNSTKMSMMLWKPPSACPSQCEEEDEGDHSSQNVLSPSTHDQALGECKDEDDMEIM